METKVMGEVRNQGVQVVKVGSYMFKNRPVRHVLLDGEMWFSLGDVKGVLHMNDLLPNALWDNQVRGAVLENWGERWPDTLVNLDGVDALLDFADEDISIPFRKFLSQVENITRAEHEFFVANGIED